MHGWGELNYFKSHDWEVNSWRLDEFDREKIKYNPSREVIFKSLEVTSYESTKVVFIGQDPYPNLDLCTGMAFSIPRDKSLSGSLANIFRELVDDLHTNVPSSGDLTPWAEQGVLLWNPIPICIRGRSKSCDWYEWEPLTEEILCRLGRDNHCPMVFLGGGARKFVPCVLDCCPELSRDYIIELSHPSPRSAHLSFLGSRVFSTVNSLLEQQGDEPIDWRLP